MLGSDARRADTPTWRTLGLLLLFGGLLTLTPLACGSQGGTRVSGHTLEQFYAPESPAGRLAAAAARGDVAEVASLVKDGADPNAPGREGMLPLMWAFLAQNEAGVRALLAAGADPNRRTTGPANSRGAGSRSGVSPIALAVGAPDPRWLSLFLEHGGNPNGPDLSNEPLIFGAINTLQPARVRVLIERGADVNARGLAGETPLITAAEQNQFPIVRDLLARGADWRARDGTGRTLAYVVQSQQVDAEFTALAEAQRWVRAFLEAHGVEFPVSDPAEQRRADSSRTGAHAGST